MNLQTVADELLTVARSSPTAEYTPRHHCHVDASRLSYPDRPPQSLDRFFMKGGPIMWPLLAVSIVAFTVIAERIIWWSREKRRREPEKVEKVFACVESGDSSRLPRFPAAPRIRSCA